MIRTVIYESATKDMSFNIGGIRNLDSIDEESFRALAARAGIGEKNGKEWKRSIFLPFYN